MPSTKPIVDDRPLVGDRAQPDEFRLMHDTGRKITQIALKIPSYSITTAEQVSAYDFLLKELHGCDIDIVAVADERDVSEVTIKLGAAGFTASKYSVIAVPHACFLKSDVWMRDCLFTATTTRERDWVFIHAGGVPPGNFQGLSVWLSAGIERSVCVMDFLLDGGSSLVLDDTHWIVGAEGVESERKAGKNLTWRQAIQAIEVGMGRAPIVVGSRFRDKPHKIRWLYQRFASQLRHRLPSDFDRKSLWQRILIVAPAGASAASQIARDLATPKRLYGDLWSHIDMVVSATGLVREGKPVVLVGDPSLPECPPAPRDAEWKAELDSLAGVIEEKEFCVIRNPTPCFNGAVLGYNNTIVQTHPNVVMLPVFSDAAEKFDCADRANVKVWTDLGFRVVEVPGWRIFGDGAIRCATLPLRRAS